MPNIAYIDIKYDKSSLMTEAINQPLTFISREDDNTFMIIKPSCPLNMKISFNGGLSWKTVSYTDASETGYEVNWNDPNRVLGTINKGETIMVTALEAGWYVSSFWSSGKFDLAGNILSLCVGNYNNETSLPNVTEIFNQLFMGTKVVDASKLILSPTLLRQRCYREMFQGCSDLTNPPVLKGTTLALECYGGMFNNCTSLLKAPELPATTLAGGCYMGMFENCVSLIDPPKLPATTLAWGCYYNMFYNCRALTTAPDLPATTLEQHCYHGMFNRCASLLQAPELKAIELEDGCYNEMFKGCTSLNYIKIHATGNFEGPSYSYTYNWVNNVADTGTFIKAPNAAYDIDSDGGVPIGWTLYNIGDSILDHYNVILSTTPIGAGTVTGEGNYPIKSDVTVTATASTGYRFIRWEKYIGGTSREIVSYDSSYTFTIKSNVRLLAVFVDESYEDDHVSDYFYIEAVEDNCEVYVNVTEDLVDYYDNSYILHYKVNNDIWKTKTISYDTTTGYPVGYPQSTFIERLNANDKLYIGADYTTYYHSNNTNNEGPRFNVTNKYKLGGNILSLLYFSDHPASTSTTFYFYDNKNIPSYCFNGFFSGQHNLVEYNGVIPKVTIGSSAFAAMFHDCTGLYSVNNKLLSNISTLASLCYDYMFAFCSSLTTAPELPATTLAASCYIEMFYRCKSLVNAPALPATTLAGSCYEGMFTGCTSLTTAPELPATTLASDCYKVMFKNCTLLTTAPELPATTLASDCYKGMFAYCSSLNYIKTHAIGNFQGSNSSWDYTYMWAFNVAPTGTFLKSPDAAYDIDSHSGIPIGWTVYYLDGSNASGLYNVNVQNSNANAGDVSGSGSYESGATVTIAATANSGYTFKQWVSENGTVISTDASYSFTISSNVTFIAVWEQESTETYYIDAVSMNPTYGTVSGGGTYNKGATVILTATAKNGYKFNYWLNTNIGETIATNPLTFVATENAQYKANFVAAQESPIASEYANMYFTIESLDNNNEVIISMYDDSSSTLKQSSFSLEYKLGTDGYWSYVSTPSVIGSNYGANYPNGYRFNLNAGEKISFRNLKAEDMSNNIRIGCKERFKIYGNIISLDYRCATEKCTDNYFDSTYRNTYNLFDNGVTSVAPACKLFKNMFYNNKYYPVCKLVDASNLVIYTKFTDQPLISVYSYITFESMFSGCTYLTSGPTTLTNSAELLNGAYAYMFEGCTSLVNAPNLPTRIITAGAYMGMFKNCTSLVVPPTMNAEIIDKYSCASMFEGCSSLATAPALNANLMYDYCYQKMFKNCTSLVAAPELNAKWITNRCYYEMFYGCSSLNYVKCTADSSLTQSSLTPLSDNTGNWLYGVAESGTFVKNGDADFWTIGASGIPPTWVQTTDGESNQDKAYINITNSNSAAGTISVSPDVNGTYVDTGTQITIVAVANQGYEFDHWEDSSGTVISDNISYTLTVDSNVRIIAIWGINDDDSIYSNDHRYFTVESMAYNNEVFITVYSDSLENQGYQGFKQNQYFTIESRRNGTDVWDTSYDAIEYGDGGRIGQTSYWSMRKPYGFKYNLNYGEKISFRNVTSPDLYIHVECKYLYKVYGNLKSLSGYNSSNSTYNYYDDTNVDNHISYSYMFGRNFYYGSDTPDYLWNYYIKTNELYNASNLVIDRFPAVYMFANCENLVFPPDLPATKLDNHYYQGMFKRCTSLVKAPELPATTLKYRCYYEMFWGCTSLNYVKCLAESVDLTTSQCTDWLYNVAQTGTFIKNSKNTTWSLNSASGIPEGWSVLSYNTPSSGSGSGSGSDNSTPTIYYTVKIRNDRFYEYYPNDNPGAVFINTNFDDPILYGQQKTLTVAEGTTLVINLSANNGYSAWFITVNSRTIYRDDYNTGSIWGYVVTVNRDMEILAGWSQ